MVAESIDFIAHVRQSADDQWELHSLQEHLEGVACLAGVGATIEGLSQGKIV